jgi:hypothetical protein
LRWEAGYSFTVEDRKLDAKLQAQEITRRWLANQKAFAHSEPYRL